LNWPEDSHFLNRALCWRPDSEFRHDGTLGTGVNTPLFVSVSALIGVALDIVPPAVPFSPVID
jgi:hypothetical protein